MPLIDTALVHPVVLAGTRTPVLVHARGFGLLRVGDDVRHLVLGSFSKVVYTRAARRIEVRFGFVCRTLEPAWFVVPGDLGWKSTVRGPAPRLAIPRVSFDAALVLPMMPRAVIPEGNS